MLLREPMAIFSISHLTVAENEIPDSGMAHGDGEALAGDDFMADGRESRRSPLGTRLYGLLTSAIGHTGPTVLLAAQRETTG